MNISESRGSCRSASSNALREIEVTTQSSIAMVVEMRVLWPFMQPSPKNCPGSRIPTTASLPWVDSTVSLTRPFWM